MVKKISSTNGRGLDERFYPPGEGTPSAAGFSVPASKRAKFSMWVPEPGCPYLLEAIGPEGSIWAIDFAEEMVKIGRKKFRRERVIFEVASVEDLPIRIGSLTDRLLRELPHFEDKESPGGDEPRLETSGTLIIAHALSSVPSAATTRTALRSPRIFCPRKTRCGPSWKEPDSNSSV
jgi:hypothetical protein